MKAVFELYGDTDSPLLAPRGVCFANGVLAVSDTANNRVCLWYGMPKSKDQTPDIILGQSALGETDRNQKLTVSAHSMQYPSGIWTDGKKLVVADAWNHRVLIWNELPKANGQAADVVVGQVDFEHNEPNKVGLSQNPSADSLYWCYGVYVHEGQLFVADTGNRRVLVFDEVPTTNGAKANQVIGQASFEERDYDPENALWPYAVKVSEAGALLITDTQYYRCLGWKHWKNALQNKAEIVLGQQDMLGNGQNQYRFKPEANTLNWCYDACFWGAQLVVADTGNSRILGWEQFPESSNASAKWVLGQEHFNVIGESSLSMRLHTEPDPECMYWPFSVNSFENQLIVADTGNHRILFYEYGIS